MHNLLGGRTMKTYSDGHQDEIERIETQIKRLRFKPDEVLEDGGLAMMHMARIASKTENEQVISMLKDFHELMRNPDDTEVKELLKDLQQQMVTINREYKGV